MCTITREGRRAFTLVELLVAIGIISVLVAILMPALSGAREAANQVKCLSNLRSMVQAAHMHAQEHRGYMPAGGFQGPSHLGVSATDYGLNDHARRKYMYYLDPDDRWRPLPLPAALAHYMGKPAPLYSTALRAPGLSEAIVSDPVRRLFTCPSQNPETVRPGRAISDGSGTGIPEVSMSFVLNADFLGRVVYAWGETPAGRLAAVRYPGIVFLFGDGLSVGGIRGYGIHGSGGRSETLYDRWPSHGQFDHRRHRNRMNLVFVDGHGETVRLPVRHLGRGPGNEGDLGRIGLTKGIWD